MMGWIPAFAGMTGYFPDFAYFDSLPPSEALISLRTTEKQCLVAHDIYLIINDLALKVCEVGSTASVAIPASVSSTPDDPSVPFVWQGSPFIHCMESVPTTRKTNTQHQD